MSERGRVAAAIPAPEIREHLAGAGSVAMALPLGLRAASLLLLPRRSRALSGLASLAILAGSAIFRVAFMAAGDESALRPEISLRFAQPENLPKEV